MMCSREFALCLLHIDLHVNKTESERSVNFIVKITAIKKIKHTSLRSLSFWRFITYCAKLDTLKTWTLNMNIAATKFIAFTN